MCTELYKVPHVTWNKNLRPFRERESYISKSLYNRMPSNKESIKG